MTLYAFQGMLPTIHPSAFVHPAAVVIGDVEIGPESSIWPGVIIRGDVHRIRIGQATNVQDGAILHVSRPTDDNPEGAPLILGNRITVGHGVVLHGCTIADEAMIGMGATVMDKVQVADRAMVAAGSLVPPGKILAANSLWMGSPAQFRRLLTQQEIDSHLATASHYVRLAQQHRQAL